MIEENETLAFHVSDGKWFFEDAVSDRKIRMGKSFYSLKPIIGEPYGSIFEIKGKSLVKVKAGGRLFPDPVAAETGDVDEPSTDNRDYYDTNSAQQLSDQSIADLRNGGASGQEIIQELVANSSTWQAKTEFSKQKYLKKKQQKYMPRVQILPISAETLCQIYVMKKPAKILSLRYDSLGQILTYGNVYAGAQVLVIDTCMGLVIGAIAERLGGFGRVLGGYEGKQPSVDALRRFNFGTINSFVLTFRALTLIDDATTKSIVPFPFSYLDQLKEAEESLIAKVVEPTAEEREALEKEIADRMKQFTPEQIEAHKQRKLEQQKRRDMRATPTETRNWLRAPSDSLILACEYDPKDTFFKFFPLLGSSKPFVVYYEYLQPLAELFNILQSQGLAINLQLSETWTREYQVLPKRTHPEMIMTSSTGFILTGIKVLNN